MANQVSVELLEIPFSAIPGEDLFKLNYQENLNANVEVAEVANEANSIAEKADERNGEQDKILDEYEKRISDNSSRINRNSNDISNNTQAIQGNTNEINATKQALSNHTTSNSQHGVTGVNVGSEDYCQALVGGVVLLAGAVSDLSAITVNIGQAPATYDQAYAQSVTDAVNSLASKQSDIINKVNEIIAGQKTAKQMSSV